jgi:hypothetical protein
MIRKLALGGVFAIGFAATSAYAIAKAKSITATIDMAAHDQSHLIGYKNGNITDVASAQIDACIIAFLDGKTAMLKFGETLEIIDEMYQPLERETCAEEALLPSGTKYCRKYGPLQNLVGQITRLKSNLTGREIQIFCLVRGDDPATVIKLREQSFGALFTQTVN